MGRYELTDEQWATIADLFPSNAGKRGAPFKDHRRMFDGMLWVLCSGAPWRDLPARYGAWKSVYGRFNRYRRDGTFARVLARLHLRLDGAGLIDLGLWEVDSTAVRAHKSAAGARHDSVGAEKKGGPDPSSNPATTPSDVRGAGSRRRFITSVIAAASRSPRRRAGAGRAT